MNKYDRINKNGNDLCNLLKQNKKAKFFSSSLCVNGSSCPFLLSSLARDCAKYAVLMTKKNNKDNIYYIYYDSYFLNYDLPSFFANLNYYDTEYLAEYKYTVYNLHVGVTPIDITDEMLIAFKLSSLMKKLSDINSAYKDYNKIIYGSMTRLLRNLISNKVI
jgi:hypothetical protein